MSKRMILTLLAAVTFVVAIGSVKFGQVRAAMAQASSFQPPPEAVTTIVAREEPWPTNLSAIGTVTAVQGVTVSADLPGIVAKIAFESGRPVRAGEMLVQLDSSQERAQLAAAEAARDLASLHLERHRGLVEKGVTSRADFDRAGAEFKQAEARVNEILATIDRKTIRAPFSGILGIRLANLGQYLEGGDPIVPLQSLDPIYVDFSVPQQAVASLRPGAEVRVADEGAGDLATGRISAVDSIVDEATRNVRVQADVREPRRPPAARHVRRGPRRDRRRRGDGGAAGLRRSATRRTATRSTWSRSSPVRTARRIAAPGSSSSSSAVRVATRWR